MAALDLLAAAVLAAEADFHPLRARRAFGANLAHERRHLVQLAGPDDEIDVRRPLEDDALVLLRHAAQDADDFVRVLALGVLEPAQCAVDLVLGVLPDAARVEQDRVGVVRAGRQLVTVLAQAGHDELAVELVHLAADGFDVELH